ncbi:MAG: hypothetical protein QM736_09460 [Vicinamibacterales bacterium]
MYGRLEARRRSRDVEPTRRQPVDVEVPALVGRDMTRSSAVGVDHRNRGTRDDRAGLIKDDAVDSRRGKRAGWQDQHGDEQQPQEWPPET